MKEWTNSRLAISRHSLICTSRWRWSALTRSKVSWTEERSPSITWQAKLPSTIMKLVITENSFFFCATRPISAICSDRFAGSADRVRREK